MAGIRDWKGKTVWITGASSGIGRALAVRAGENMAVSPKNKACGPLLFLGSEMFYKQYQALTEAKGSDNLVSVYATFFENGTS